MHALDRLAESSIFTDASGHLPRSPHWSYRRQRIARNLRHRREQLHRRDDLIKLCLGVVVYVARTGQPFPGIERETLQRLEDLL